MRTLTLLLTGLLTAWTAPAAAVPRPSPDLILQRGSAPPFQLSQFRGKIVALAFAQTTCNHCQFLTQTLKVIQKDYAKRNVQVVECAFEEDVNVNYPMFLKAFSPNFPTGYTTDVAVKAYLQWNDHRDGMLLVPYMVFIDANGIIQGDFSGKDGFFRDADKRIRAELDKMTKSAAKPAPKPAAKKQ
jgi:thiol-disulfide isomerase/thioredoxin